MLTCKPWHLLWLRTIFLLACTSTLLPAQTPGKPFGITVIDVAYALSLTGVHADTHRIQLQASVPASQPGPLLRLLGQEQVGSNATRFRFTCADAGVCLPFYALVTGAQEAPESPSSRSSNATPLLPSAAAPAVVHAGAHATLFLENHFMRISLPVILIDTGHAGNEVRVASLDRKQTYRAKVADDGSVHGDLP